MKYMYKKKSKKKSNEIVGLFICLRISVSVDNLDIT